MKLKQKSRRERRKNIIAGVSIAIVLLLIVIAIGNLFSKSNSNTDNEVNVIENHDLLEIETKYCSLYYPTKWKDTITVKYSNEAGYKVEFYGNIKGKEEIHLFDVCFNSDDGTLLGYFDRKEAVNISIDVKEVSFNVDWTQKEKDHIYSMQEDVNFVIDKLELEDDYVNPEMS